MKKQLNLFVILIVSMGSYSLHALETLPLYAGVGYGVAKYEGEEIDDPVFLPDQRAEGDDTYWEAYVGLDLGDIFSIEAAYAAFGEVEDRYIQDPSVFTIVDPNNRERVDYTRYSLMAVAEYPLTLGFSVFATGGYAFYDFDRLRFGGFSPTDGDLSRRISNGDHGMEWGLGAKWEVIDRVSIRGQWSQSLIGDRKVQSNRLSVEFHF